MDHLAFYNVGSQPTPGGPRLKAWVRRQFRRVLLPMSQRLVEILGSLCHRLDVAEHEIRDLRGQLDELRRRHDEQAARAPAALAFGWDYVAMVRRLAALEEHVDALLAGRAGAIADPSAPASAAAESKVAAAGKAAGRAKG